MSGCFLCSSPIWWRQANQMSFRSKLLSNSVADPPLTPLLDAVVSQHIPTTEDGGISHCCRLAMILLSISAPVPHGRRGAPKNWSTFFWFPSCTPGKLPYTEKNYSTKFMKRRRLIMVDIKSGWIWTGCPKTQLDQVAKTMCGTQFQGKLST